MHFYSGFSLAKEEVLFAPYHDRGDFCIAGFSLGAIDAFEFACESKQRVDKLQLFSPAFFQEEEEKFKRLQRLYFRQDKKAYVENFLKNIAYPSHVDMSRFYRESDVQDLDRLLGFVYKKEKLQALLDKSIMIEVYVGSEDKIIDIDKVATFFREFATIIEIKNAGHILKGEEDG